ncbi:MAG: hypothetical protein JNK76_26885 [Planctomycetales bacterium]|nr:hypothetical protein [Planctomycetales bacterium]
MKVTVLGMEWEIDGGISLSDYFANLTKGQGKSVVHGDYERLLYVGALSDFYVGLFVTQKDQRKQCEVEKSADQKFRITVRDLKANSHLADFNFFVLNKTEKREDGKSKYRGLFQYYHNSCSLTQFGVFCANRYGEQSYQAEAAAVRGGMAKSTAAKKFSGSLTCVPLVRPEALSDLLKELEHIKTFEFSYATFVKNGSYFAHEDDVKSVKNEVRFSREGVVRSIAAGIGRMIEGLGIAKGKVVGVDESGLERTVKLLNTPDSYGGKLTYEEVAEEKNFPLDAIEKSPFIGELAEIARKNKDQLGI